MTTGTSREKLRRLKEGLHDTPKLAVSFSGGVDSMLLLKAAVEELGPGRVVAITARAENFPERELREAEAFAKHLGVRHVLVDFDVMAVPEFRENAPERCYYCKKRLFGVIMDVARRHGADIVADGANLDDSGDHRPGMRAARELGVRSPLRDAGLGKDDIRRLLREDGVPDWDKPSLACLASRVPYGTEITRDILEKIDRAENALRELGWRNVRVRHHGDLARIEVEADERRRFWEDDLMDAVDRRLRELGYTYVALDLRGYRTGSMNEGLP